MKLTNKISKIKSIVISSSIIILIFLGMSCEKVITINLEDAKIKIVVNAIIDKDSTIMAHITRSRHILDNAPISALTDADARLLEDGVVIGNLIHQGSGVYRIDYKPIVGKEYRIEVKHDIFDDVYADTKILNPIPFQSIDTFSTYDEWSNKTLNFSLNFSDPAAENNYYILSLLNEYTYMEWDNNLIVYDTLYVGPDTTIVHITYGGYFSAQRTENVYLNSEDIVVEEYVSWGKGLLFSDELINGKNYSLKFNSSLYNFYGDTNLIHIKLYSITREHYLYLKSLQRHYNNQSDPFAEPVMVFSNIVNGIGIFGAQSAFSDTMTVINQYHYYYEK